MNTDSENIEPPDAGSAIDEATLRKDLNSTRERLDRLVSDLQAEDLELEGMEPERQQYRVLQQACSVLNELDEIGAGSLFWGGIDKRPDDHLQLVQNRVDEFENLIHQVESRRQKLLNEIQQEEDSADLLEYNLFEAERLEEERQHEWLIERDVEALLTRVSTMPWARGGEDDRRFRKSLAGSLAVALLLALILPMIDIPIPERWQVLEEQERLTQLIRDERPPPPPVEITKAEPVQAEEAKPEESESEVAAEELITEAAPAATPAEKPSAQSKGILAFREKFSSLANTDSVDRLGSNARISNPSEIASGLPERSMVTSQVGSTSGGINVAALSRDTGGTGKNLGGVAVTQATSSIGSGTGAGGDRPLAGGGPGLGRTDEEIQIVFDRHKAALYRMYNRELRKNPTLRGQMVLRLRIEPDGSVSMCELKSTDMKAPNLSKQVVGRVKTFDFGAKEGIAAVTIVYPIDFLPAT